MTQEVVVATLNRIEEYLKKTKRKSIELTFLGGEPLITGIDFIVISLLLQINTFIPVE